MSIFEIHSFLVGWVLQKIREWAEVAHSGQDRKISPMGRELHGWDGLGHRERDRGCSEQSGYGF